MVNFLEQANCLQSENSMKSKSYLLAEAVGFDREIDRLRWQAQILFSSEWDGLKSLGFRPPRRILELGCGNGQYLAQWQKAYLDAQVAGADRHNGLLTLARTELPHAQFFLQDLLNFDELSIAFEIIQPDTVILRFVLQHLSVSECERLLAFLKNRKSKTSFQLILIEPDDSAIEFSPPCAELKKAIEGVMQKQFANGGDRTRGHQLVQLTQNAGFLSVAERIIDIGAEAIGWQGVRSILVPLWKQGVKDELMFQPIERWVGAAEAGINPAKLCCPIHLVLA